MQTIKSLLGKDSYSAEHCDWKFHCRINRDFSFKLHFDYPSFCNACGKSIVFEKDNDNHCHFGLMCPFCDEYNSNIHNSYFDKITSSLSFEVIERKDAPNKEWDIHKFYKTKKLTDYYAVVECKVMYEPNEWSSSAHDDHFVLAHWFDNETEMNAFWNAI